MINPYQTQEAKILKVKEQAKGIKSFDFVLKSGKELTYEPGQFFVFSLPGYGESVFVPMEKAGKRGIYDIAVQKIGRVTSRFHQLKKGDIFGLRGPYGNGWGVKRLRGRDLLLIAGGIGLVPIRGLINYLLNRGELLNSDRQIQLFYGCRGFSLAIYRDELEKWSRLFDVQISLDKGDQPKNFKIKCYSGVITVFFKKAQVLKGGIAALCGPPVIYKFIIPEVIKAGYSEENILLSLERRMHCAGLGTCQHCAIGPYYTCVDGPVFSYSQLKDTVQYGS